MSVQIRRETPTQQLPPIREVVTTDHEGDSVTARLPFSGLAHGAVAFVKASRSGAWVDLEGAVALRDFLTERIDAAF